MVLRAVVVDDNSQDGTAQAIAEMFGDVTVLSGPGDLYWAAGMALAEQHACRDDPDFLLWLNDDVNLGPNALSTLVSAARQFAGPAVVAGAVRSKKTGATTYGAVERRDWHPMRFRPIEPAQNVRTVDTVHGNVLLVPRSIYRRLNIDANYAHAYADFDYGLRVQATGGKCVLAPGHVGFCEENPGLAPVLDGIPSAIQRLRVLNSPKGLPVRSQVRYLRRHGGPFWPAFVLAPYIRVAFGRSRPLVHER